MQLGLAYCTGASPWINVAPTQSCRSSAELLYHSGSQNAEIKLFNKLLLNKLIKFSSLNRKHCILWPLTELFTRNLSELWSHPSEEVQKYTWEALLGSR